jgi:hypothetical protein
MLRFAVEDLYHGIARRLASVGSDAGGCSDASPGKCSAKCVKGDHDGLIRVKSFLGSGSEFGVLDHFAKWSGCRRRRCRVLNFVLTSIVDCGTSAAPLRDRAHFHAAPATALLSTRLFRALGKLDSGLSKLTGLRQALILFHLFLSQFLPHQRAPPPRVAPNSTANWSSCCEYND